VPPGKVKKKRRIEMKYTTKLSILFSLVILASLVFVPGAQAFDGRSSDKIVIAKDEVINDDLYLAGNEIVIDGTVNGDVMAAGTTVVVNGLVTGDLWAAGQTVTVNGKVGDDLFAGAYIVTLGPGASIADDVFSGAGSVETKSGSQIGGELLIGAFQGLVSGDVMENLRVGANRLRLEGIVSGNAWVAVNPADQQQFTPRQMFFVSNAPPMPPVPAGLTFGDSAKIAGKLVYTSASTFAVPSSVVAQVEHQLPPADEQVAKEVNQQDGAASFVLDALRRLIALLLVGLLVARFLPSWILKPSEQLQARPWPSLGAGFISLVAAPLALMVAFGVLVVATILFGLLTLGELVGTILSIGLPVLFLGVTVFVLVLSYIPQAVVAYLGGRWILQRARPAAAEKIYWPLVLGLVILGLIIAIPFLGGLIQFIIILFGLGAIALLLLGRRPAPAQAVTEA
jgi:cytoskeletal protein CcmA (bactofilin family)